MTQTPQLPDTITLSHARGIRRHAEALTMQRVDRLVDSQVLQAQGRFGASVRRLHSALLKTVGKDRCLLAADEKRRKVWVLCLPDDDGSSDLAVLSLQRGDGATRRRALPLGARMSAHFIERLTQLFGGVDVPIATIGYVSFMSCRDVLQAQAPGTVYIAVASLLVIARHRENHDLTFVTALKDTSLDSDKQSLWNRLAKKSPPVEFWPDDGAAGSERPWTSLA